MLRVGGDEGVKFFHIPSPFSFVFSLLLCILPFSIFLLPDIDMWNGNGLFFQAGVFALFLLSFVELRENQELPKNIPFLAFSGWAMLSTAMMFYDSARFNFYNLLNILSFINLLTFFLFYKLTIEYMTKERIKKVLLYMTISVGIVALYCLLQRLNLDQFQHPSVEPESLPTKDRRDFLVGTIGNPTHLACYLAMALPLFYRLEGNISFAFSCLIWAIIGWTGSASGLITAVSVTAFYGIFFRMKIIAIAFMGVAFYSVLFFSKGFDILRITGTYLNPSGRFEMWERLVDVWRARPIFGYGLGFLKHINSIDKTVWSHAHCEVLQTLIELGLIGASLAVLCVYDFFKTFSRTVKSSLEVSLCAVFVGFIVSGLFNFTAHLWLTSVLGMVSYSFMYVLRNEEEHSYNV